RWLGTVLIAAVALLLGLLLNVPEPPERPSANLANLSPALQQWHAAGRILEVLPGYRVFTLTADRPNWSGDPNAAEARQLCLIHGFPSSSFDYRKALPRLLAGFHRVVMFDHVGFGFSGQLPANYSYSIQDHADVTLAVWKALGVRRCHAVAHDMGDSVLAELLTRHSRGLLPDRFQHGFFQSVTFTNGGMIIGLASLRLSQRILRLPLLGPALAWLGASGLQPPGFVNQQLRSIWGPGADEAQRNADIADLLDLNREFGAAWNLHRSIRYLDDRFLFEQRWLDSLGSLRLPCRLLWGDSDAVSPQAIPRTLHSRYLPQCRLHFLTGVGHFLMMEAPISWADFLISVAKETEEGGGGAKV
ncbi:hypothetical protein BOX15_Mlig017591g2, partial [Macrostomum lignano]